MGIKCEDKIMHEPPCFEYGKQHIQYGENKSLMVLSLYQNKSTVVIHAEHMLSCKSSLVLGNYFCLLFLIVKGVTC